MRRAITTHGGRGWRTVIYRGVRVRDSHEQYAWGLGPAVERTYLELCSTRGWARILTSRPTRDGFKRNSRR